VARTNAVNFSGALQFPMADAATDLFKKEDVQTLALAVDGHDHSAGKGLVLPASAIPPITSAMIADGTITSTDIADGTIQMTDLANGAVSGFNNAGGFNGGSTTSTSPVAVPGLTTTPYTVAANGRLVVVYGIFTVQFGAVTQNCNVFVARDGSSLGCMGIGSSAAVNQILPICFTYLDFAATAGSHTWGVMWSTSAGTISLVSTAFSSINIVEVKR
jgi:hypothetical protein